MTSRKLIPSTIIPPELYVRREADRQLKLIIDSAARPATVLVARQMGKTNLLLNAKRELEDESNAFIYIDLSIPLTSDRECFRHIIDTAVDTRPDLFQTCQASIQEIRGKTSVAAFKEHEIELRLLLTAIKGKLIIILDEIDSLAKGSFSDKVFAQIRSVYFSRVNYPQFKNLTYVLSGVLEPNEIIKDKRISPFNIAEKIYLDDFSFDEYEEFLSRAGLHLIKEVKDRIFFWANGNPRITWDICADLEDKIHKGYILTPEEADHTVQKLYLKDFIQSPVDHIRELVASDDDLRNAITQIKFNRGHTLSDEIKNKLYLGGIIGSGKSYKDVTIKNKVIEAALSDQWLHDVGVKRKGLLKLAQENYENNKFAAALSLYEQFLAKNELPEEEQLLTYYRVGSSAYHLGDYQRAVKYLCQVKYDKESLADLYYELKLKLGICFLQLNKIQDCQSAFREVLESSKKDSKYLSALVNYGSSFMLVKDHTKAIEIYNQVIYEIGRSTIKKEDLARTLAATYVNLGNAVLKTGDPGEAKRCFDKAIDCCLPDQRPAIVLELVQLASSKAEKRELLANCVRYLIDNNVRPITADPEKVLALNKAHLLILLATLYELDNLVFRTLFEYVSKIEDASSHPSGLLYELAIHSLRQRKLVTAAELAKSALQSNPLKAGLSQDAGFDTLRLLCYITKGQKRIPYVDQYLEVLKSGFKPKYFSHLDLEVFSFKLDELTKNQNNKDILELVQFAKRYLPLINQEEVGGFAMIYVYEINALNIRKNDEDLKRAVRECVEFIDALPEKNGSEAFLGGMTLDAIKTWALSLLQIALPQLPALSSLGKKIGRNEKITVRYHDGTVKADVKYKKVENDLMADKCILVEP